MHHITLAKILYRNNSMIDEAFNLWEAIFRALASQDKIYPLNDALEVMDNLMALDTKSNSLDDARDYIKALAPLIKGDQIEYDSEMNPLGVSGAHTPSPPFHWKCMTSTSIV